MTTPSRSFASVALFAAFFTLSPAFVAAQTPPPATPGTHPDATPPTTAPTEPLPATSLPNGSLTAPATTSAVAAPAAKAGAPLSSDGLTLYTLIAAGVIILASIGWFLRPHKGNPTPFEPTAG